MRTVLLLLTLLTLGGCFYTGAELREVGLRHEFSRPSKPEDMANCIGRNIVALNIPASVLKGTAPGTWEVSLQMTGTVAVVDVAPEGNGARATVYVTPGHFGPAELAARLLQGC